MLDLILELTVYLFSISEFAFIILFIIAIYGLGRCIDLLIKL